MINTDTDTDSGMENVCLFCEDPSMAKQDGDEEGYPYNKEHMP